MIAGKVVAGTCVDGTSVAGKVIAGTVVAVKVLAVTSVAGTSVAGTVVVPISPKSKSLTLPPYPWPFHILMFWLLFQNIKFKANSNLCFQYSALD